MQGREAAGSAAVSECRECRKESRIREVGPIQREDNKGEIEEGEEG